MGVKMKENNDGRSSDSRVLHLGNVANTGTNLVDYARSRGRLWALRDIPAAPSLLSPKAWVSRGKDAVSYSLGHAAPDIAHIHYGPNGYYRHLKRVPSVLHLHGTDLRQDLHRPLIGQMTARAIADADAVVVATPDLLAAAKELRQDAIFIPNPVPIDSLKTPPRQPIDNRVVFSARWDDSKGGLALVDAAADLARKGYKVVGVNWGPYAEEAKRAGARLLPLMRPDEFRELMAQAQVVVGQVSFGSLGISDLEALAVGRPLVTRVDEDLEGMVPVSQAEPDTIALEVDKLMRRADEAEELGSSARQWVISNRHPELSMAALESLYGQLLD